MRHLLTTAAAALFAAASGHAALAACAARDLAGEWSFYNTWWEDTIGLNWSRCLIEVDKTGAILAVTACEDSDDRGEFDPPLIAGTLAVTPDCVVTGGIEFGEVVVEEEVSVDHATMTTRKNLIAGVGSDVDTPPTYWTFTMIKR